MAKKVLSILVGTEYTKVCEVSYKKNYKNRGIRVYRSVLFATPRDTVEDGFIKDPDVFGEELRNQLRTSKIKSDKVIFSLASTKIANREIVMPPVKEKRIMEIIKTGASEYFPIDMKDYILSYQILDKNNSKRKYKSRLKKLDKKELKLAKKQEKLNRKVLKKKSKTEIIADNLELLEARSLQQNQNPEENTPEDKNGKEIKKQMRLSVYAAPSTLIKNYYSFAKQLHLDIIAMDYSGNSSYQAIKRQIKRGTNVFVQMNEQDTLISILRDDVLILQRTVSYGFAELIETVMEQEYYKLDNPVDALALLSKKNLLSLKPEDMDAQEEAAAARESYDTVPHYTGHARGSEEEAKRNIRDSLHMLSNSIARMLDYYKSTYKTIDIGTIYLTGVIVRMKGVEDFFTTEIGITHKIMDKLYTFSSRKKAAAFRENPSRFLTCIGAVVQPVDFIPYEFILKKQRRSAVIGTFIFTLACLAGSAGTAYVSYMDFRTAKQVLDEAKKLYEAMPPLSGAHEEYNKAMEELDNLNILVDITESNNDIIKDVIGQLEKKLPSGTIIHSMKFTETEVIMNVTANDDEAGSNALIAKILKQLKDIVYFKENVDISGITVENDNGVSKVNFSITCTYVQ